MRDFYDGHGAHTGLASSLGTDPNVVQHQEYERPTLALVGGAHFAFCIPAFLLIDRLGRRPLLAAGAIGMGVSMAAQAAFSSWLDMSKESTPQLPLTVTSITAVLAFLGFYSSSWGVAVWVVATELVPLRYASRGSSRQLSASPEPLLTRA